MSEPAIPPPQDPATQAAHIPALPTGRILRTVISGLAKDPLLLFGFGTMLLIAGAGQILGGDFMAVGWILLGIYVLTLLPWWAVRRAADKASTMPQRRAPISVAESEDVRIHESGNVGNGAGESAIDVTRSQRVEITGSGNTGSERPSVPEDG